MPQQLFEQTMLQSLHHSHLKSMRLILPTLLLLALFQLMVWLLPAPAEVRGIAAYLPLHTLLETISIVVAMLVFAVGWNARDRNQAGNIVWLACIFFAVGWLDFSHTLSYKGMPDFVTTSDPEKAINFWLAARYVAAIGLLLAIAKPWIPFASDRARHWLMGVGIALTILVNWLVLFHQDALPRTFITGQGLTPLKINLEYLLILLNLATALLLWLRMRTAQPFNVPLMFGAVCVMAMSEFFFTLYASVTDIFNVLGHVYKVIAYLLIYRAIVVEGIEEPYRKLHQAQQNLALAVQASNTGLWDWNIKTNQMNYSPEWKAQLGYLPDELPDGFATWESLLHPEDRAPALQRVQDFLKSTQSDYENEFRLRHRDGHYRWILARGNKLCDARGQPIRLIGSHIDISERKQTEQDLKTAFAAQAELQRRTFNSELRYKTLVDQAADALFVFDLAGRFIEVNRQACDSLGYTSDELLRMCIADVAPEHDLTDRQSFWTKLDPGKSYSVTAIHRRKDGSTFPVDIHMSALMINDEKLMMALVSDITQRKQAEQQIRQLANFDALTGLPNRMLLNDRVGQAISAAQRDQTPIAVLFLDLDHFKNINDTLGHRIGDALLVEVSKRLRSAVRDQDTVSRMGGDEFLLLLPDSAADGVAYVAAKLLVSVAQPYHIERHELVITPSVGIAMFPEDGENFDTLYQHADTAMYRAKQDGRNNYRFFTQEMQAHSARTLQLESALRHALEADQLLLHYQPQLAVADGRVIGVEALLRWQHPGLGMVPPAEFIPIAESSGQVIAIGAWVLRTAVRQLKAWLDSGLPPMVMAVNLSAVQFRHPDLPGLVSQILAEAQLPPQYLELELTEGVAMDNPQSAIAVMDDLHQRGVRMSIDDFGTGYSSLSYLKKFKVYKLKIDQSFVRDLSTDEDDSAIVTAIIQMAHSLGMQTIAEGVETAEQLAFLRERGCGEAQGYHFSKPLPSAQLETFVKKWPAHWRHHAVDVISARGSSC